jgi:hypothetical protein
MAWKKIITLPNRTVVEFWELLNVNYNHRSQKSEFIYGGWVDKAAYDDGIDPVIIESLFIDAGEAPELAAGALLFGSIKIRSQEKFEGSEDV